MRYILTNDAHFSSTFEIILDKNVKHIVYKYRNQQKYNVQYIYYYIKRLYKVKNYISEYNTV